MDDIMTPLQVPKGDKAVYTLAETYFTSSLTAYFRPKGYDCYREYEYGGGSTFMPVIPTAGHMDPAKARILRMLQNGFKFMRPTVKNGVIKERGHQKPDFLAFREFDGVIGEIGTHAMRAEKTAQVRSRLRDLEQLVAEELRVQSFEHVGRRLPWAGMRWRPSGYAPAEGPVLIPVDAERVISTAPTFTPFEPGVYLYQLYQARKHQLKVGVPVVVPKLGPKASEEARELFQQQQQPQGARRSAQSSPNTSVDVPTQWPTFWSELKAIAIVGGTILAVAAAVVVIITLAPELAAAAAVAAFAAFLASTLSNEPPVVRRVPLA